MLAISAARCYA